jgi:hypothetical protein
MSTFIPRKFARQDLPFDPEAFAAEFGISVADVLRGISLLRSGRADLIDQVIGQELDVATALRLARGNA